MSEATFLEYNKDNIFINLIQAEDHFRNLEAGFGSRGEFLSCISKHLAYVEGESSEAVSHSLMVEGPIRSQEYTKIRDEARNLRKKIQAGDINPENGIREIRRIRSLFEKLNPLFDTSRCRSCGSAEETLKQLRKLNGRNDLQDMERDLANHVLNDLSTKYGVEPPRLTISNNCYEPNEGHYKGGTIQLCHGGVNIHVLLHEFKHYYDHKTGKSLNEADAEAFARDTIEKGLYASTIKHYHSDNKMPSKGKDIALVIGGVNVGWGIGYAAKAYVDPKYPASIMGQDPSLLIDGLGTIAGVVGAFKLKKDLMRKLSGYIAAGLSVHLWEDLMNMLPVTPAAAQVAANRVVMARQGVLGVGAVGESIPTMPAYPTAAVRLAEYPFPSPVSVGQTMSPPHYTINGVPGLKTVSLGPKYTLDTV